MNRPCIAIVGAGQAGARASLCLRENGWSGRIVLIGEEEQEPYERPPLSKGVLSNPDVAPTRVADASQYEALGIELRTSTRATALDTATQVLQLETANGRLEELRYDKLLLATGGRARRLAIPGSEKDGVITLRSLRDARRLASRLVTGAAIAVIGGGFIGLEVAAAARLRGCEVIVLEAGPRLLGRAVPASIASKVHGLHVAHGVDIRVLDAPIAFEQDQHRAIVHRPAGKALAVDTIVVGIGMEPDLALARKAGLQVNRGILVNDLLQASAPGIYAAGDVCEFPRADGSGSLVRESWDNAESQAKRVASNMTGEPRAFDTVPWMWSDQYDHTMQLIGRCQGGDRVVVRELAGGHLEFNIDASGCIVGAAGFAPSAALARPFMIARRLVEGNARRSLERLADSSVPMKALLSA